MRAVIRNGKKVSETRWLTRIYDEIQSGTGLTQLFLVTYGLLLLYRRDYLLF